MASTRFTFLLYIIISQTIFSVILRYSEEQMAYKNDGLNMGTTDGVDGRHALNNFNSLTKKKPEILSSL